MSPGRALRLRPSWLSRRAAARCAGAAALLLGVGAVSATALALSRTRQYDVPFTPCETEPPPPWTVGRLTTETPVSVADGLRPLPDLPTTLHLYAQSRRGFQGVEHELYWLSGGKREPVPGSLVRDGIVTDGSFKLDFALPPLVGRPPGVHVLELLYRQVVAKGTVLGCVRFAVRVG